MDPVSRIRAQRLHLEFLLKKLANPDEYGGRCYWCNENFDEGTFSVGLDSSVNFLEHHRDENRSNNDISNLVACHASCHQAMHSLSRRMNLPTIILREMVHKQRLEKEAAEAAKVAAPTNQTS